jgi:anaerobic selenocysteine-containing dehydrogenase
MAEQPEKSRRTFFKGLGLVAAAGAAAKAAPPAVSAVKEALASDSPDGNGYRLTDHVKKYYRTTTI